MAEYISEQVRQIDGNVYDCLSGTLTNGTTDYRMAWQSVTKGYSAEFVNNSATADYTIKLNSTSNDSITIDAGTSKTIDDFEITAIYLSNASGSSISYQVTVIGA